MIKLLFITQKIDKDDDILGVYHYWAEELAKRVDKLSIICLGRGKLALPENVRVYSLGKEKFSTKYEKNTNILKKSLSYITKNFLFRIQYILKFWHYIFYLRKDYEVVLVHMNSEYVLLGGWFWKLLGKKIFLWYNHPLGGLKVRWAAIFCKKVFYTSLFAFAAKFRHSQIMPAGIDTVMFKRDSRIERRKNSILYLGRISKVKNLEILIDAAKILKNRGVKFCLKIVGSPIRAEDFDYEKFVLSLARNLGDIIEFQSAVPNTQTPPIYNSYEIVVNLTDTGSLDKAMFEAMACENMILASNKALQPVLPPECFFEEKNSRDLANKLENLLAMSQEKKSEWARNFRQYVVQSHDLLKLMDQLVRTISHKL